VWVSQTSRFTTKTLLSFSNKNLDSFIKFYHDQKDFLRSLERCQSALQPTSSVEKLPNEREDEEEPQIRSEEDLLAHQAELVHQQNIFVDNARSIVRRSDSFEQLINVTARGQSISNIATPLSGPPAFVAAAIAAPPQSNKRFYLALATIIASILVVKYAF